MGQNKTANFRDQLAMGRKSAAEAKEALATENTNPVSLPQIGRR
jgi:hypothetical protein